MLEILKRWLRDEMLSDDRQKKFWERPLQVGNLDMGRAEMVLPFVDPTVKKNVIHCCGGNYLGIAEPEHGFDSCVGGSPLIGGHHETHVEFEKLISQTYGGYPVIFINVTSAVQGFLQAITRPLCKMTKGKLLDLILFDQLNHSCLMEGLSLADVVYKRPYKHCNIDSLKNALKKFSSDGQRTLILTDGIFSMEGDIAPLDEIVDLANKYNAVVLVDDAHATGVLGKTGRGTCEHFGFNDRENKPIQIISFSKAIGGLGAALIVDEEIASYFHRNCRNYIFCGSLSPYEIQRTSKLVIEAFSNPVHRKKLNGNVNYFRNQLKVAGFDVTGDTSIIPVHIGASEEANDIAQAICFELYLEYGIYCRAIEYPVVPFALLRFNLSAAHTTEQLDYIVSSLVTLGRKYNVI